MTSPAVKVFILTIKLRHDATDDGVNDSMSWHLSRDQAMHNAVLSTISARKLAHSASY